MIQLWDYFGVVGIASILLWVIAAAVAIAFLRSSRRSAGLLVATIVAQLALVLAGINSAKVSAYRVDRSGMYAQARRARAPQDSDPNDPNDPEFRYAYQKRSKVQRDPNAAASADDLALLAVDRSSERAGATGRLMPEADVVRANDWDRLNLFFVRWVSFLTAALLGLELLSRFVPTLSVVLPARRLPPLDARNPSRQEVERFLRAAVRRGESFVYLGPEDPLPGEVCLGRLPKTTLLGLQKVVVSSASQRPSSEMIFEGSWFRRQCYVVTDRQTAAEVLADTLRYLRLRKIPRARVLAPVNFVWQFGPIDPDRREALEFYARQANYRLILLDGPGS